jgi:hypothetical protein
VRSPSVASSRRLSSSAVPRGRARSEQVGGRARRSRCSRPRPSAAVVAGNPELAGGGVRSGRGASVRLRTGGAARVGRCRGGRARCHGRPSRRRSGGDRRPGSRRAPTAGTALGVGPRARPRAATGRRPGGTAARAQRVRKAGKAACCASPLPASTRSRFGSSVGYGRASPPSTAPVRRRATPSRSPPRSIRATPALRSSTTRVRSLASSSLPRGGWKAEPMRSRPQNSVRFCPPPDHHLRSPAAAPKDGIDLLSTATKGPAAWRGECARAVLGGRRRGRR